MDAKESTLIKPGLPMTQSDSRTRMPLDSVTYKTSHGQIVTLGFDIEQPGIIFIGNPRLSDLPQ